MTVLARHRRALALCTGLVLAWVVSAVAEVALAGEAAQAEGRAEAEIRSLLERIDSARLAHDPAAVADIYSNDFYIVHNNGAVTAKTDWLRSFRTASFRGVRESMRFKHFGDTILVLADVRVTGKLADGRAIDVRERVTYVWLRRDGRWQLAAMHGTRIPQ